MPSFVGWEEIPRLSPSSHHERRPSASNEWPPLWTTTTAAPSAHQRRRSFSDIGDNAYDDGHHHHDVDVVGINCSDGGAGFGRWGSLSYYRLPEHRLNLTVLKLDGSSFDVQVSKSASVSELRLAVEEVFSQSPKEGEGKISWSHVWGHFCLCYNGHKLVDDKASLRTFGIKDGDELHFIRHLSINHHPIKRRPRNHGAVSQQHRMSLTGLEVHEDSKENDMAGVDIKTSDDDSRNLMDEHHHHSDEYDDLVGHPEFKLAHFLREWLSYS